MQNRKRPEDIPPPRTGVKLKKKQPQQKSNPSEPKVMPASSQNLQTEQLPPPTDDALKIINSLNLARQQLIQHMQSFNKLLSICTLPENKSLAEKGEEKNIIDNITKSVMEIDKYSNGEGTLALGIFIMRQALFFRDAGNKLAYEMNELKKQISKIYSSDRKDEAENRLLELAKELGVEITIGGKK